jgi:hypothetical protein
LSKKGDELYKVLRGKEEDYQLLTEEGQVYQRTTEEERDVYQVLKGAGRAFVLSMEKEDVCQL